MRKGVECGARLSACRRLFRRRRVTSSSSLAIALVALAALGHAQDTLRLTLKEAEKTALQNNPQIAASRYTAEAAAQVPAEVGSVFQPTLFGSVTRDGADSGSRIAAGALNNPILYDRLGTGLSVNQLFTDFGCTGALGHSSKVHSQSQQ